LSGASAGVCGRRPLYRQRTGEGRVGGIAIEHGPLVGTVVVVMLLAPKELLGAFQQTRVCQLILGKAQS